MNGRDVFTINTATHHRTHIQQLPFESRCTATGCGWFCAGGDNKGYFTAFRIPETTDGSVSGRSWASETPIFAELGKDINNSITISPIYGSTNNTLDDVVAVITNNDKSVRMYSLMRDKELPAEDFAFAMNHASISPDSKTLIIVGDEEVAYFYHRAAKNPQIPSKACFGGSRRASSQWVALCQVELYKPKASEFGSYFTTAWSQSGRLCATGSEQGYITVFDVDRLYSHDSTQDAIVAIVPSSRPDTRAGAVRSMCFAPDPWDLLIWVENNGHVCTADLRTGLSTRQVVDLDPLADGVTSVGVYDRSMLDRVVDDLHHSRASFTHHSTAANAQARIINAPLHLPPGYRPVELFRAGLEPPQSDTSIGHGLTFQERQIIHGLGASRRREIALQQQEQRRLSRVDEAMSWYNDTLHAPRSIRYSPERQGLRSEGRGAPTYATAAAATDTTSRMYRDWLRDPETIRRGSPLAQEVPPRRRSSIVISPSTNTQSAPLRTTASPTSSEADDFFPSITRSSGAWDAIEAASQRESTGRAVESAAETHSMTFGYYHTSPAADPEARTQGLALPSLRVLSAELDAERRARQLPPPPPQQQQQNSHDALASQRQRGQGPTRNRHAPAPATATTTTLPGGGYESAVRRINHAFSLDDAARRRREIIEFSTPSMHDDDPSWGPGSTGVAMAQDGRTL